MQMLAVGSQKPNDSMQKQWVKCGSSVVNYDDYPTTTELSKITRDIEGQYKIAEYVRSRGPFV